MIGLFWFMGCLFVASGFNDGGATRPFSSSQTQPLAQMNTYDYSTLPDTADNLSYGDSVSALDASQWEWGAGTGEGGQWTQGYDEQGYPYWYNNATGVSQYQDPFAQ